MRSLLLVLALAFGALLYLQWEVMPIRAPELGTPGVGTPAEVAPPAVEAPLAPNLPDAPGGYDVIAQRPLFLEERRPPDDESPADEGPQQPGDLQGLDLTAVLIRPGESVAWVRDPAAGETLRLAVGDLVRGWHVTAIDEDTLHLQNDAGPAALELREFPAVAPPPPRPAVPFARPPRNTAQPRPVPGTSRPVPNRRSFRPNRPNPKER